MPQYFDPKKLQNIKIKMEPIKINQNMIAPKVIEEKKQADQTAAKNLETNRAAGMSLYQPSEQDSKPIVADNTALNRRYETLRARSNADVAQQTGEQQDALKRRFAALGNLSSGAALKQEQLTSEKGAQLAQRANEGLDVAQSQEQMQLEQDAANKEFARQERIASQRFASGERAASQGFASFESQLARDQQQKQFDIANMFQQSNFAKQMEMASKQFDLEKQIQEFNLKMAQQPTGMKKFQQDIGKGNWSEAAAFVADPAGFWG